MAATIVRSAWNGAGGVVTTTAGAPVLSGLAGAYIAVLDFCLGLVGWTKIFSGTNTAAYQSSVGNRTVYSVDDTPTSLARVRGFESALGPLTGIGQFPTELQFTGGLYASKSQSPDSVQRPYLFWGNSRIFHFITTMINIPVNLYQCFGDIVSLKYGGEAYGNTIIVAGDVGGTIGFSTYKGLWPCSSTTWAATPGHYMCRPVAGIGSSTACGFNTDVARSKGIGSYEMGGSGKPYPDFIEGGLTLSRMYVVDPTYGPRGYMPGVCVPCHSAPLKQGDTFTPAYGSEFAGRTYETVSGCADGQIYMETSDTWDF